MKYFFFCLLFIALLVTTEAVAQKTSSTNAAPGGGGNPSLPLAHAFIGTWEWRSGSDIFRIVLRREPAYVLPNGQTRAVILGQHSYTRNGVLVEQSFTSNPKAPYGWSLFGTPHENWRLNMGFIDLTKDNGGNALLTINPATPNQLQFEVHQAEGATVITPNPSGFTVPTSVTLTRIP